MATAYRQIIFVILTAIVFVSGATATENNADIVITSSNAVEVGGEYLGHHFSSKLDPESSLVKIEIELKSSKLVASIGRGKARENRQISLTDRNSGKPVSMTTEDQLLIQEMLEALANDSSVYRYHHGKVLLKLLNLMAAWPVKQLDLNSIYEQPKAGIEGVESCEIPENQNGITDICWAFGSGRQAGYPTGDGPWCGIFYGLKVDLPEGPWVYPFTIIGDNSCVGRCGKGCIGAGLPNNGLNIYTEDCLNHDVCVEARGIINAECNWMFVLAENDFWEGENCPEAGQVIPDIKANGEDSDVTIRSDESVSIAVSLDPGNFTEKSVDWWVYAETARGPYYYVGNGNWIKGTGRSQTSQLFNISSHIIYENPLFEGDFNFVFAVDDNNDGIRDETWIDSVTVTVADVTPNPNNLNDAGITMCSDTDTNGLPCPVPGFPGQDAEYGRDVNHNDDSDGHAGFSFTKLDTDGNSLPASAAE